MALVGDEEPRADLNPFGSEHERRGDTSAVEYSTCGKDRNVKGVNHLRHKRHCMDIPYMSSGFGAFGHDGCRSEFLHLKGVGNGRHNRDDLDSGGLPFLHIGGRGAGSGRHDLHAFLDEHVCHFPRIGSLEHDVDTEWLVCQSLAFADLFPDGFRAEIDGGDQSKSAGV